jgi:branched-subunit amino acid transport protein
MTAWVVVLAVGAGSYLLRSLPVLLGGRRMASPAAERATAHAGTAALAALVATSVAHGSATTGGDPAMLAGAAVGVVAAVRGQSMVRVLMVGSAAYGVVLLAVRWFG